MQLWLKAAFQRLSCVPKSKQDYRIIFSHNFGLHQAAMVHGCFALSRLLCSRYSQTIVRLLYFSANRESLYEFSVGALETVRREIRDDLWNLASTIFFHADCLRNLLSKFSLVTNSYHLRSNHSQ